MKRVILNVANADEIILAGRSARHLIDNPEKQDALLQYGDSSFWARRNKASISVWSQQAGGSHGNG